MSNPQHYLCLILGNHDEPPGFSSCDWYFSQCRRNSGFFCILCTRIYFFSSFPRALSLLTLDQTRYYKYSIETFLSPCLDDLFSFLSFIALIRSSFLKLRYLEENIPAYKRFLTIFFSKYLLLYVSLKMVYCLEVIIWNRFIFCHLPVHLIYAYNSKKRRLSPNL